MDTIKALASAQNLRFIKIMFKLPIKITLDKDVRVIRT